MQFDAIAASCITSLSKEEEKVRLVGEKGTEVELQYVSTE